VSLVDVWCVIEVIYRGHVSDVDDGYLSFLFL